MHRPINAKGEPMPLTEVPQFEPGHGRPDLETLHTVLYQIDTDLLKTPYEIREWVAVYLSHRTTTRHPAVSELLVALADYDNTLAMPDQAEDIATADLIHAIRQTVDRYTKEAP